MRPTDALAAHRRTMQEIQLSLDDMCTRETPPPKPWGLNSHFGLAEHFIEALRLASTYFVASDMMELLDASWETIPDLPLADEESPSSCGYMLYDRSLKLVMPDTGDKEPVYGYLWISGVSDFTGNAVAYPLTDTREDPTDLSNWYSPRRAIWHIGPHASDEMLRDLKPLRATWAFMRQKLAVSVPESVDRAERRRCAKLDLPQEVNVVRVRKREQLKGDNPEHRDVEWSHRWLVSGHWRQQPCGPGREDRRPTWIPGHIKGPDDKPLVIKDKVTAWVR